MCIEEQFDKILMREGFKIVFVVLLRLFLYAFSSSTHEVSVSCMMVYDEGGASSVLESPECPQWGLSAQSQNRTRNCQFAMLQGHREYQEDRIACNLKMSIPVLGKDGPKEVLVGVVAVFDGHGGKEASEMASKNLLDYFFLHVVFNTYSTGEFPPVYGDYSMLEILKKALLRTIHDIDTKFSLEAFNNRYVSGSTATIVLLVDGQILVANVGDSKALLCSEKIKPVLGDEGISTTMLDVEELTGDHHPNRDDEKARIEAAGGFVRTWGVPRVNGILAVSRSIGDVYLKRYGVIPVPEVIGWRRLTANDSYLVVASDGIFESLTPQKVCDLLWDANIQENEMSESPFSCPSHSSLADCIINKAFEKGSGDNLSAIVIPLNFTGISQEPVGQKM